MTGPTFTPDWSEHNNNEKFEHSIYSDRLEIDDWTRKDLVTRSGLPVTIDKVDENYAWGTVNGEPESWYRGNKSFVREADSPHEHDVILPNGLTTTAKPENSEPSS